MTRKRGRRRFLATTALLAAAPQAGLAQNPPPANNGPADAARELPVTGADLGRLFADFEPLIPRGEFPLSFLQVRFRSVETHRSEACRQVEAVLGTRPEPTPPRAEVVERVETDDHVRERVLFSTTAERRVPAYVLIPRNLRRPAPAIVDLHSHGGMFLFGKEKVIDFGRNHAAMVGYHETNYDGRPTATALARRGYVVIVIDAFGFGERRTILDADRAAGWDRSRYTLDDVRRLNLQCRAKETTLAKAMTIAGETWAGVVSWDDRRTVDYLASRPEVDARRIGCLGISMGGYRAMYLGGLDDRVKATCVVGFMSTIRPMARAHVDTHSWVHFVPGLHRHLDWPDLAALAAPRALLVQQCSQDRLFPLVGMRESVTKMEAIFAKAGCPAQFSGRFYDAPHRFTRPMQDEAFAWLDRHLGRA